MSQPLPRFYKRTLQAKDQRMIAAAVIDSGDTAPTRTVTHATLPGDARRLRGIPAIGRSVSGCIPGTNPEQALR